MVSASGSFERTELEETAKQLKELARACNTCVLTIAHTRKLQQTSSKGEPRMPTIHDEYGNGGLQKWADCIIGVALDPENRITYLSTIKRNRMGGEQKKVLLSYVNFQLIEVVLDTDTPYEYNEEKQPTNEEYY
jgi:hypothetical protein